MVVTTQSEQPAPATRHHTKAGASPAHRRPSSQRRVKWVCATVAGLVMADTLASTLLLPMLGHDPVTKGVPVAHVSLLTTAYLAAIAALLTPAGRLADRVGRRAVLAVGLAAFAVGALTMAFGSTWALLLTGRLAQGIGAALMLPSALALLLRGVGQQQSRGAVALWGSATGIGGLTMQAVGGVVIEHFGWRSLCLPIGMTALAVLLLVPLLPRSRAEHRVHLDLIGMALMTSTVAALVLLITCGSNWGWTSPSTVIAIAVSLAGTGLMVSRSRRRPGRVLDGPLWRCPGFGWGAWSSLLYGLVAYTILVVGPMVLREAGMSPSGAGLVLAPMSAAVTMINSLAARLTRHLGTSWAVYAGALLSAIGCLTLVISGMSPLGGTAALIIMGAGFGILTTAATISGTLAVDPHHYGEAVGTITTARILGAAIGPAIALAYLTNTTTPAVTRPYEVLLACMTTIVLLAGCALARAIRKNHAEKTEDEVTDLAIATARPEDIARLREALLRQRARFEAMASAAEDELTALTDPRRARSTTSDTRMSLPTAVSHLGGPA
ncbi:DHA2 family methylenomycin A resistance protein-like MFS transporter [Nonomuraea fuscirosea]|uniref:DHA2 family methylenomycin A resistance protein-like MFS transporter n=1 Tax=Nonomuraea fuscirosea TaxID=1291556 RepID=A0A2T0LRW3_9ACTN|nr:DHA2 family methylenomycin A resistance protein-like MFS transporter [Nonomuraea fuscirosea]